MLGTPHGFCNLRVFVPADGDYVVMGRGPGFGEKDFVINELSQLEADSLLLVEHIFSAVVL